MSARWDNHFLRLAQTHAEMSKDPNTRVGAVIVGPDREIRATGFNGFPRRICDDPVRLQNRETKLQLVVHAECNAICAAARVGVPLLGCTLYLAATDDTGMVWGGPPCTRCTVASLFAADIRAAAEAMVQLAGPAATAGYLAWLAELIAEAGPARTGTKPGTSVMHGAMAAERLLAAFDIERSRPGSASDRQAITRVADAYVEHKLLAEGGRDAFVRRLQRCVKNRHKLRVDAKAYLARLGPARHE